MDFRIGIDVGSKTIKIVVLDGDGKIVNKVYHRHRSDVRTTLVEMLHDFRWRFGDYSATVAVTGSAGIAVAEMTGLPFVQEVVATTKAVQTDFPDADCVIELGGEDAKIIYLTGGLEQRMNATCAGGTGGFIDNIAHMIGVRSREMSGTAMGASRTYPIASRCAVFAQTDVRPLLNAGASKADIAASALEAVVRQTLGGLACGRPVRGKVIFLGGPMEYNSSLVQHFRKALGVDYRMGVKPDDAHLITAKGVAIMSPDLDKQGPHLISELEERVRTAADPTDDLDRLPPLFVSDEEREAFKARHDVHMMPRKRLSTGRTPFFLGLDAGSTAIKYALIDADGVLLRSDYRLVDGNVLKVASKMLGELVSELERSDTYGGKPLYIARAIVTGYGEDLLKAGLGFDAGVVETTAHVRAARQFCPNVSFVLDIGGQDMKALWVRDGHVVDAVLNEACSSGCGAFVEGIARSLKVDRSKFAQEALESKKPVDLGTKCTVFMNSRVRHAQKIGALRADISAGIAYSVVKNALYRIIGRNKAADLGDYVVVQGGTFKSDAVLRAFELISGIEAIRPDTAHLMGALGAALAARDQVLANRIDDDEPWPHSALISSKEMARLAPKQRTMRCPGCANRCLLSVIDFGKNGSYVSGNRCDRAWDYINESSTEASLPIGNVAAATGRRDGEEPSGAAIRNLVSRRKRSAPNAVAAEQALLARYGDIRAGGARGGLMIGLMNGLNMYQTLPFWHTLLAELGFSVVVPKGELSDALRAKSYETVPSESVCQPAKLLHARYFELVNEGVDAVFMPHFVRGRRCPVTCWYPVTLRDNVNSWEGGGSDVQFLSPELTGGVIPCAGSENADVIFACLEEAVRSVEPLARDEFDRAFARAADEQEQYHAKARRATQRALDWVHAQPDRHGVVIAGRPYHMDPALLHGIDEVLERLGVAVIPADFLPVDQASKMDTSSLPWSPAKHIMRISSAVIRDPSLEMVALVSFNCGFDALSFDVARREFSRMRKPFTELKIDDIVDTAHIRIRLRTLVEGMMLYGDSEAPDQTPVSDIGNTSGVQESADNRGAVAPGTSADCTFAVDDRDLESARAHVTADLCFTAAALSAHVGNMMLDDPGLASIRVPEVCKTCLVAAVPMQAARVCGRAPEVEWTDMVPAEALEKARSVVREAARRRIDAGDERVLPKVGIVGNSLLCFDPFMNEGIVELLDSLDCEVVLPEPELLFTDDVRYLDQLDRFAAQGVGSVIYLQSFSCLKGHTHARGALRDLAKRYPGMTITVLDYDPESSALNRENRIRLVAHAAHSV